MAFALVESSVVVYLRQLYYPEGFSFPMKPIPENILFMEMMREAATMVMLVSAGIVAGGSAWRRFAFFMYCFGLWDIGYYIWLKLFIGWPVSLLEPDILFLFPVVWWGPVLAPVIVAFSLCMSAVLIIHRMEKGWTPPLKKTDIFWIALGAGIILYTFMADAKIIEAGATPPPYRWRLFATGEGIGLAAFAGLMLRR